MKIGSEGVPVERLAASAYKIPTDAPESDGTFAWDATILVVVEASAGGKAGIGFGYADASTATFINEVLRPIVDGRDAMGVPGVYERMGEGVRNLGRAGVAWMAISAVDAALWDLKGRLLDLPLVTLLGAIRPEAPVYGSGGFTSYSIARLEEQLGGWVAAGIPRVKMKIGTNPDEDPRRVAFARRAIGEGSELFVDANGAYSRKQALAMADRFAAEGVTWFEEPVSSDDLEGLRLVRDRGPAGMEIAAGEYGYAPPYFKRMLDAGAVDVLQADATRCGGVTGFFRVASLCESANLDLSAHCAPSLHVHLGCASTRFRHLEFFHDHDRIEHLLFDGAPTPVGGALRPDLTRPGLGLDFKRQDAARFAIQVEPVRGDHP